MFKDAGRSIDAFSTAAPAFDAFETIRLVELASIVLTQVILNHRAVEVSMPIGGCFLEVVALFTLTTIRTNAETPSTYMHTLKATRTRG